MLLSVDNQLLTFIHFFYSLLYHFYCRRNSLRRRLVYLPLLLKHPAATDFVKADVLRLRKSTDALDATEREVLMLFLGISVLLSLINASAISSTKQLTRFGEL